MPAYRTVVVGTDGSSTSLAAVDRAAQGRGQRRRARDRLRLHPGEPGGDRSRGGRPQGGGLPRRRLDARRGDPPRGRGAGPRGRRARRSGRRPSTARRSTCCTPRSPSTAPTCSSSATRASTPCPGASSARCRPTSRAGPGWTCSSSTRRDGGPPPRSRARGGHPRRAPPLHAHGARRGRRAGPGRGPTAVALPRLPRGARRRGALHGPRPGRRPAHDRPHRGGLPGPGRPGSGRQGHGAVDVAAGRLADRHAQAPDRVGGRAASPGPGDGRGPHGAARPRGAADLRVATPPGRDRGADARRHRPGRPRAPGRRLRRHGRVHPHHAAALHRRAGRDDRALRRRAPPT